VWVLVADTNALSLRDSKVGQSMKATLRYLAGIAGPSGFGSNSTAEQVTQDFSSLLPSNLTALITGKSPYNNITCIMKNGYISRFQLHL